MVSSILPFITVFVSIGVLGVAGAYYSNIDRRLSLVLGFSGFLLAVAAGVLFPTLWSLFQLLAAASAVGMFIPEIIAWFRGPRPRKFKFILRLPWRGS